MRAERGLKKLGRSIDDRFGAAGFGAGTMLLTALTVVSEATGPATVEKATGWLMVPLAASTLYGGLSL